MTAVTVFLRNLAVILVVGGIGYGLLRLPYDPLLIGGGYASLLAVLMTLSELSHGKPKPRSNAPRGTSSKARRPRSAQEKAEAPGTPANAPEGSSSKPPAAQNATAPSPKKRAKPPARHGTPPQPGVDRARQ
jgi:hypothetical protein